MRFINDETEEYVRGVSNQTLSQRVSAAEDSLAELVEYLNQSDTYTTAQAEEVNRRMDLLSNSLVDLQNDAEQKMRATIKEIQAQKKLNHKIAVGVILALVIGVGALCLAITS